MKYIYIFCTFCMLSNFSFAQKVGKDLLQLQAYEDTLKELSDSIVQGGNELIRTNFCYEFIKKLVKTLQLQGAFEYPFDSLTSISIINSPDNKLRIFTWQLLKTQGTYRFYGVVFMNSPKKFKIFPLFDASPFMRYPDDTVVTADAWYGCIYYNIIKVKKYYILFGWDANNLLSDKKVIDVLHFNKEHKPLFGAPLFYYGNDSLKTRIIIEYKKDAGVSVNYDETRKLIIYDHLIPEHDGVDTRNTFVPEGSYEGFEFVKGKWNYLPKIFPSSSDPNITRPIPKPILD